MTSRVKKINYSKYKLDVDLNIISVDSMFEEITGYSNADVKNLRINQVDLLPNEDKREYMKEVYDQLKDNGEAYIEHRLLKKDGTINYVYCFGTLEEDKTSTIRVVRLDDSLSNVQLNKDFNRRISDLKQEAKTDNLTGLLRRDPYSNSINYHLSKRTNLSFLIIDIDNFKGINDTYGHQFGDEVLVSISNLFCDIVKDDGLVCRLGGDEFSVTLLNIKDETAALEVIKNIINRVQSLELKYDGKVVRNTVSIGVFNLVNYNYRYRFNDLYTKADRALYESKGKGKNCYTIEK